MNRSITAAWGSQNRGRNKLSLNTPLPSDMAPVPPKGSAAAAAAAAAGGPAGHGGHGHGYGYGNGNGPGTGETAGAGTGSSAASGSGGPAAALAVPESPGPKRKARSSRGDDGSSRRKRRVNAREDDAPGPAGSGSGSGPGNRSIAAEHEPPAVRFKDLGGMADAISKCLELVVFPLIQADLYAYLGIKIPRGVLLHGPPGCGKTRLAQAIAGEVCVPFLTVAAPALVSGTSGESEKALRDLFAEAVRVRPSIIFLDEIDAITPKRETAQREMERRIVAQLLTCMDDLEGQQVMVIGATNRPDSLDPALRRGGRFDREIALGVPDEHGREAILRVLSSQLKLSGDVDFRRLAKATPGYVGADLTALTSAAGVNAIKRIFSTLGVSSPGASGAPDAPGADTLPLPHPSGHEHGLGHTEDNTDTPAPASALESEMFPEDVNMLNLPSASAPEFASAPAPALAPAPAPAPAPPALAVVPNDDSTPAVASEGQPAVPGALAAAPTDSPTVEIGAEGAGLASTVPDGLAGVAAAAGAGMENADAEVDEAASAQVQTKALLADLPEELSSSPIAAFLRRWPGPLPAAELAKLAIVEADFIAAVKEVQPSSTREGFATVPGVTWADVGALRETREELDMAIVKPIKHRELFAKVLGDTSSGVLLWGPPGCGKTLLAKAVASASRANFISVKGPELLNKYVGESERAVRQVFARARASAPCVIFFDELDALVPRRDDALSESSARVVNTLLTELDGLESRGQTYVVAATNRPDIVDPAMCRPGRLDRLLYIDLPSAADREDILRALTRHRPLSPDVDLHIVAHDPRADGFSGADCAALVRQAAVAALQGALAWASSRDHLQEAEAMEHDNDNNEAADKDADDNDGDDSSSSSSSSTPPHPVPVAQEPEVWIKPAHFGAALDKIKPSVTPQQRRRYEALRTRLAGGSLKEPKPAAGAGVADA